MDIRKKVFTDEDINFANVIFHRKFYDIKNLPKNILHAHAGRNKLALPVYETRQHDRLFYSIVTFEGKKYSSLLWSRHRRFAEQTAALVCVLYNGLVSEDQLLDNGSLLNKIVNVAEN